MKKYLATISAVLTVSLMAGCGGGGGTSATATPATPAAVSGTVADGYLVNATVFMDKNGNYQLDQGEPSATTDQNGAYTLNMDPADVGKYPIMAIAIKGQTIDKDTNQTVQNSYMLSLPAAAVSGSVSGNFISPMSTLLQEKMAANPGMTLADAMTQLRNQLNMPTGVNMTDDYVAGAKSGQYQAQFQEMHQIAQQMASLMASQAGLVMNGSGVNMGRFREMMGEMNQNMPQIANNVATGMGMNSTFMNSMLNQMQTAISGVPVSSVFGNFSSMFRNMTSHHSFWNYSSGHMQPRSGMMGK